MRILIVGGGIGGLTAALACLQQGHEPIVLEQSDSLEDVGAGIQIPPNATRVLDALGVLERVSSRAVRCEAIETRMGETGRRLFRTPLGTPSDPTWGAPYYHIHRADYVSALADELDARSPGALRLGHAARSFQQSPEGVSVTTRTGETLDADLLVGADGIHSIVRESLFGANQAQFTGHVAWRVVLPVDRLGDAAPEPVATAWMGRGRHGVTYLLRNESLANFVGIVEHKEWTKESWTARGNKSEAVSEFAGWHPTVTKILEQADPDAFYRWALFDRTALPAWSRGRVTLLGDAAHPMLPFLAQGAAMAVEDAWSLANQLDPQNVEGSLRLYEQTRRPRTRRVQAASRANGRLFHRRTAIGRALSYGPMWLGGRFAPSAVRSHLNWLYGYDVTA